MKPDIELSHRLADGDCEDVGTLKISAELEDAKRAARLNDPNGEAALAQIRRGCHRLRIEHHAQVERRDGEQIEPDLGSAIGLAQRDVCHDAQHSLDREDHIEAHLSIHPYRGARERVDPRHSFIRRRQR